MDTQGRREKKRKQRKREKKRGKENNYKFKIREEKKRTWDTMENKRREKIFFS